MKALITAGGRATRLRPITHTINKHLIPLANKPMIFYAIEKVAEAGITDIYININPGDKEIPAAVGDGSRFGARVTYIEQTGGPKGVAHIIANAEPHLAGGPFLFYFGDNILFGGLKDLIDKFQKDKLNCLLLFAKVPDPERFGVPVIKDGRLIKIIEKPQEPSSNLAQAGIYLYDQSIFEAVKNIQPSARGEYEISDANTYLIERGHRVGYEEITGWWKDTGQPRDLLEGAQLILDEVTTKEPYNLAEMEGGVVIEGAVQIGRGTKISGRSLIRWPAVIGANCLIHNSRIGPYASIGQGVEVTNSEITNSLIMDGAKINCEARLVNSIIGHQARVSSSQHSLPASHELLIGDNSVVEI